MDVFKKEGYRVPVFSWCPSIEESALIQIEHLAMLPFVFLRIAIMPDCHSGYGMPIGGVIACLAVVIVNAVGVK
jgi:tRNA-splicing ligase RtcB